MHVKVLSHGLNSTLTRHSNTEPSGLRVMYSESHRAATHPWIHGLSELLKISVIYIYIYTHTHMLLYIIMCNVLYYWIHAPAANLSLKKKPNGFWEK